MATRVNPRSATDATRFTSTTPHASSKPTAAATSTAGATSPAASSSGKAAAAAGGGDNGNGGPRRPGPPSATATKGGESPEERVRRLRAAHQAAKAAQVSKMDTVVGGGRKLFDFAHRFTIAGLLGFTALAGLVSVYSVYDMVVYNRRRREDFAEARSRIEADSLASARLAFINGSATEEQISLVEDANAKARETGVKLPPLLAPSPASPAQRDDSSSSSGTAPTAGDQAVAALDAAQREALLLEAEQKQGAGGGSSWWPFRGGSSSAAPASPKEDENIVGGIRDSAHTAFQKERENQKAGGALDQLGRTGEQQQQQQQKKKGWLW